MKMMLMFAFFITQSAFAASASRIDAQSALSIAPGTYVVTEADSAIEKENLCVKGTVHTVKWTGQGDASVLSIGNARIYMDFNSGLIKEADADGKNKCAVSSSTQAQKNRLIEDDFTNCEKENTTSHTDIYVNGDKLEYVQELKVSRSGKVISIPAKCTLVKKAAK